MSRERLGSSYPQRPRGSQSGREKRRDESFQVRVEEPLGTDSHRTISKRSSECWLLVGPKKMLCMIVPNRRTASPEFFSCVHTRQQQQQQQQQHFIHISITGFVKLIE